jgi:YVTN family beta-propeller protein
MRKARLLGFAAVLWLTVPVGAQRYAMTRSIPLSGNQTYWDYLIADPSNNRLYVTHETEVLVLELNTSRQVGSVAGLKRAHGVALVQEFDKGFVTDSGDNTVAVFDLKSNAIRQKISAGNHPDAVVYEPTRKRVYAFNPHSHDVTVIDPTTNAVVATVPVGGTPEFAATDGKGNVYVNLEDKASLVHLNSEHMKVVDEWPMASCKAPSGLAIDPRGRRLFSACDNKIMVVTDADTGRQVAKFPIGAEPDAAAYDAARKLVFSSNTDSTLTVVRQENPDKYVVVQNLKTEDQARTMALDPVSHRVYMPCEEVKPGQRVEPDTLPEFMPQTFHLLIVEPEH